MDAADRAELERLRRRMFGPEGDLSPAALTRWEALEAELHAETAPAESPPAPPPSDGVRGVARDSTAAATARRGSARTGSARTGSARTGAARTGPHPLRTVFTLAVVVIALFAGFRLLAEVPSPEPATRTETVTAREAFTIVRDRDTRIIERIPPVIPTAAPDAPWFATSGVVSQSSHLATLYGWEVWTAVAEGAIQSEACLSVRRESVVRGRCVPAVLRDTSALVVDLPYDAFTDDLRPDGMTDQQRLGFWWAGEPGVYVVLAPVPDVAPR